MNRVSKILHPQAYYPIDESDYLEVDADEYWEGIASKPLESFMLEANTRCFWQVMLPHWIPDDQKRRLFSNKFWSDKKSNNRENATIGTSAKNDKYAKWIVTAAKHFHTKPIDLLPDLEGNTNPSPENLTLGEEGRIIDQNDLGLMVLNLIAGGDSATLKRITRICSAAQHEEQETFGESSKYWRTFVTYIKNRDQLPTRKELNSLSNLSPERCDKVMKRLGLDGLEPSN